MGTDEHVAALRRRPGGLYTARTVRRSPSVFPLAGILPLLAVACTGVAGEGDAAPDADVPTRVSATLFVEQVFDGAQHPAQVGARFLRIAGVRDEALPELVGVPAAPVALGCTERGARALDGMDPSQAEVRLLDVGPIDVASAQTTRMTPRRFPDLWNVVSGSFYGAEGDAASGSYRFTGVGAVAANVGSFDVQGVAPDVPSQVRVGDVALPLQAGGTFTLPRHGGLTVRWQRAAASDEADRVTVVFEGASTVVCAARDEGAVDIDPATMDGVREILRRGGSVSVHRLRSRGFTAQGIDAGALVFDLSVRGRVRGE